MRFTKRLLERRKAAPLVTVASLVAAGAAASCSSTEDGAPPSTDPPDAAVEAAVPEDAAIDVRPSRDAAAFDGGPLPVVCASSPCARSLVTTIPTYDSERYEGYCALLDDGTVACWGSNAEGQLGRGDDGGTADSPTPARVAGVSNIVELDHTCARDKDGAVWCWGTGPFLRSAANAITLERTPVKLPVPPAKSIGVSALVGCISDDEGVLCWGRNYTAQVAPGVDFSPSGFPPRRVPLPAGAPIQDLLVGTATFALREDGMNLSWGANPPMGRVSSLSPDPFPAPAALGAIMSMDLTSNSGCATGGGIGYCWGAIDTFGVLDPPPELLRALPEPVATPEPVVQIATTPTFAIDDMANGTRTVQPQRWCAVSAVGAVYCWGLNTEGQAGDGTKNHAYQAVRVAGLPGPVAQVRTTPMSTCALLTTGKIYCWGNNFYGQLGNGKVKSMSLTPQEVVLP